VGFQAGEKVPRFFSTALKDILIEKGGTATWEIKSGGKDGPGTGVGKNETNLDKDPLRINELNEKKDVR